MLLEVGVAEDKLLHGQAWTHFKQDLETSKKSIQGSAKDWFLGCLNSPSQEAGFTQPRVTHFNMNILDKTEFVSLNLKPGR